MPTKAEREVFDVLSEELLDVPVKGKANRAKMENIIEVLDELKEHRSFDEGRYESMQDVMAVVASKKRFRRGIRQRRKRIHGN